MNKSPKVVVVTGASQGIGAEVVKAFRPKSLAIEYAKKGIRVNAVAPGHIKTPMHAPEHHEALGAFQPIGRMGETSDIADAVLFLDSAR